MGGITLNDTILDKSFSSNEFVVRKAIYDIKDSGFSGDGSEAQLEFPFFESEGSEFVLLL